MNFPNTAKILELLRASEAPLDLDALATACGIAAGSPRKRLARLLRSMARRGEIIRNRGGAYGLTGRMDLVRGRVIGHRDGYGFLVPETGGDDLFLSPRQMRTLMHGDRVVARIVGFDTRGRPEGALAEVLERNTTQLVGRFVHEAGVSFVVPEDPRLRHDALIAHTDSGKARPGDMVVVKILEYPDKRHQLVGRIIKVLGTQMAPGMEIEVAIHNHNLPAVFPEPALAAAAACGDRVKAAARRGRDDLRELQLVTIDGKDARDFDDAVHCRATRTGWKLWVAIADVAAYVKPGGALDVEAELRGNSVYFPDRVIPMLPEALSNGLCSLRPDEDRLCMVCEMQVTRAGEVRRSRFFEAVMRSRARLTYSEMAAIIVDRDPAARKRRKDLTAHLDELYRLYKALQKARNKRGALELDSVETRITLDANSKVERIEAMVRNDAHRLIEECMVAANGAAARFVLRHKLPCLYRVHDGAKADGLEALRLFLAGLGLTLGGGEKPTPKHYRNLLTRTAGRPDAPVIQTMVLRSMSQAVYSPSNIGHFGLALDHYAHFTSPIRRYADLVLHRCLKRIIKGARRAPYPYDQDRLVILGEHLSVTERRADDATREVISWLKCEYMRDKLGRIYTGTVTGVSAFGIFVQLDELLVEGLVHVSMLGRDYFHFDPSRQVLEGESTGQQYHYGDTLKVRVSKVNLENRKIDFQIADGDSGAARKASQRRTGHRSGHRSGRRRGR